jgi:hypothetical protein
LRKFITRTIGLAIVGYVGYAAYDTYRAGYFELPDMPDGAYQISFASGLRGIIIDAEVSDPSVGDNPKWMRKITLANPDRRYLGIPLDVPEWFVGAWSYCTAVTDAERNELAVSMPDEMQRSLTGARFDYTCRLELDDNEELVTGFIFSVPDL